MNPFGPVKRWARAHVEENLYNRVMIPRHHAEAMAANVRHGFPSWGMNVIAVTGTNGKTTTCNMIAALLTATGYKVGLLSTATTSLGGEINENDTHLTTAGGMKLQSLIGQIKAAGCDTLVLEVSSHALTQGRVWGIPVDVAVMTNLTQDHLDYHGTMENYAAAKAMLFKRAKKLSVLNIDDAYFHTFESASRARVLTYGKADLADTKLTAVKLDPKGAEFVLETDEKKSKFKMHLTGLFNVYNAMAAITVARFYDADDQAIQTGFNALINVPGRMQFIDEGQGFSVLIDHAHTTDALKKLFGEVKRLGGKRLITVIGCDGDRDASKREPIGKLCAENSDVVILTELENYTEDSEKIRSMIRRGIESSNKKIDFKEVIERREAIATALKMAKTGDIVLIPGLGNQDYRGMGEGKIDWDDRRVVKEELAKLGR
ncbi:MAG TPA: UDP-N-acetylmuramoyl-L-alanyl-D-glutamate--2,6-diaminopimelate ligase [Candidatus Saccharimonadales bacterium]|nr:UDP-N-acetylmuramoyl-L-alanyl-D-glutamate--2,6-diaminopimelate ligase [Candidatus Saccharimonadales bacterium]